MPRKSTPKKKVSTKRKYKNQEVGKYRSKLELYAATKLQEHNIPFEYEPVSVELLPAFTFPRCVERYGRTYKVIKKVRSISYTPDFVGPNWVIETKGFSTADFRIRWKLFKKFILENGYNHYYLFMPTTRREIDLTIKELYTNILPRQDKRRKNLINYER